MEIKQLKTFKAVADHLSFHKAAEAIHYAQSTVSAQIMALEDDVGVPLFERLGRQIILTEAGENLYLYANKMLELEEAARSELLERSQVAGSLTIRVPESFCVHRLPKVVVAFHREMPQVKLRFITCAQDGLKRDLRKGVTDLAFLLADGIQSADINVEIIGTEQLVFVAAPNHPLSQSRHLDLSMLAEYTLLVSRVDCSYRKLLMQSMQAAQIKSEKILEFNSVAAIIACVRQGLGLTLIPKVAVSHEINTKKLIALPWSDGDFEVAQLMIWHQDKWLSPVLKSFMDITRNLVKE